MIPYAEMISLIHSQYPDLIRLNDSENENPTSKVCVLVFCILLFIAIVTIRLQRMHCVQCGLLLQTEWSVCLSVCLFVTFVSPAKTD